MSVLLQIRLHRVTAGIEVECLSARARVTRAAPIFAWMVGQRFQKVERWIESKRGAIEIATD